MRYPVMAPESDPTEGAGTGGNPEPEPTPTPALVAYDWHTDIHPDVKGDKIWESIPDLKTLTKAHADAVRYNVGAIKMPGKDATPDEWAAFHTKLGRPGSPEAYALVDALKDDPRAANMRGVAHAAGLTDAQFKVLQEGWNRLNETDSKTLVEDRNTTVAALKEEWGEGAFNTKITVIQRLIKTFGGEETWQKLSTSPIGNDKGFLVFLDTVAKAMAEEELISTEVDGVPSREDALKEVNELTASEAYLKTRHPNHEQAVARAKALYELIYN